jgi:hypothetical protein
MAVSTARLLTFVCMALAVLLLVFNFTSYSSLMRSAGSSSFSGYRTSAEKRRAAQLHAARRAMRHTRSKAHDILNWEPYDAAEEEDDDADDDDDDDNAEHGSRLAIGASTFDPNEENAERNRRKQRRGQQQQGLEGEEETPHGGAGGGAAAATSSTPLPTAEVASVVGSAVSSTVSSVVTSAIGTANAAAAAVTHVADRLRSTAGNGACKPGKPDWPQRPLNFVAALEAPVWPVGCTSDPVVVAAGGDTLCVQLARAAVHREVVLTIVDDESPDADEQRRGLPAFLTGAPKQVVVVARGKAAAHAAGAAGVSTWVGHASSSAKSAASGGSALLIISETSLLASLPPTALKYALLAGVVRAGCAVLYADVATRWVDPGSNALAYLARDCDIEAPTTASHSAGYLQHGRVVSVDDAQMGWSRYAQSLAISGLSARMFYLSATAEAAAMMGFLQLTFTQPEDGLGRGPEKAKRNEGYELTREAFAPAHDGKRSAGVSVRVMPSTCWGVGRGSVAAAAAGTGGGGGGGSLASMFGGGNNDVLQSRAFEEARRQVLQSGCAKVDPPSGSPPSRPLNWVVPPAASWPPRATCEALGLIGLCDVLGKVAVGRRVLAAVSNKNIFHMLGLFVNGIKAANVSNAMVVALDDATDAWLAERSVPRYLKKLVSRTGSTDNHATSGLKFKILVDFLSVGCSVLLSDVDVIWLADPFPFLYMDTDVEGMTDGWDGPTSYGYDYNGGGFRVFARNSGMFYLQATNESNQMMKRLAHRMEREGTWDQTAYNEEQFYPAHDGHATVGVSSRVMNYFCNLNSKTFFRFLREDDELLRGFRPLSVHVNYHPEKPQRMVDLHAYYYGGDDKKGAKAGIWKWNGGEGSRLQSECKAAMRGGRPPAEKPLVQQVLLAGKADWGGIKWVEFGRDGSLTTPWGKGKWGDASSAATPNRLFAEFIGQVHMLTFSGTSFESKRCSDGEVVKGSLAQA